MKTYESESHFKIFIQDAPEFLRTSVDYFPFEVMYEV